MSTVHTLDAFAWFADRFPIVQTTGLPAVKWGSPPPYSIAIAPDEIYGIPTGPRNRIFVVDLDRKNGKDGVQSFDRYCLDHGCPDLPETFTVATPSNGFHFYFRWNDARPVRNRAGMLDANSGIDIRGAGGYVKAGGPYRVLDSREPVDAPDWLYEMLAGGIPSTPATPAVSAIALSPDHPEYAYRVRRARSYLEHEPVCVEGAGGDAQLWKVALHLVRTLELPIDDAFRLIMVPGGYNSRCRGPWEESDILRKLSDAAHKGTTPCGIPPEHFGKPDANETALGTDPADLVPQAPRGGQGGPKHVISVAGSRLHENVSEACAAIGNDPSVFQRAGELVRLIRVSEADADRAHVLGTPTIRPLRTATLKSMLTGVATFETQVPVQAKSEVEGETKTVWQKRQGKPDDDIVSAVHAAGEWPGTRVLNGIVETPTMRPDGTIVQSPGYDSATGYLYEPNGTIFPEVPDAPSQDDARRALGELQECFCDFPFADGPSAAVPIAALLTVIARPAIAGNVPMFVFDAPTRGSGKSLQTDVIATIATGRVCSKATWPGEDDVEAEKILGAYARQAVALFGFDNVSQDFALGGGPLDKYLTCQNSVAARILGKSEMVQCQWRTVIVASGNNVAFRGDTVRRVLVSRLESNLERPEDRTDFKHPDLLDWVRAERPRLVVAALTLLRAYAVAGRPKTGVQRLGSFEAWTDLVPAAIVWAGGPDATLARPAPEADDTAATLRGLFEAWPADKQFTSAELLKMGTPYMSGGPPTFSEGAFGEALGAFFDDSRITARGVTRKLRSIKGRVITGKKLGERTEHGTARWSVARVAK